MTAPFGAGIHAEKLSGHRGVHQRLHLVRSHKRNGWFSRCRIGCYGFTRYDSGELLCSGVRFLLWAALDVGICSSNKPLSRALLLSINPR